MIANATDFLLSSLLTESGTLGYGMASKSKAGLPPSVTPLQKHCHRHIQKGV